MSPWASSPNFGFLAAADTVLVRVAVLAKRYFPDAPVTSLMKLRQFGEALAQQVAARTGIFTSADEPQADLLGRLRREAGSPREVLDLFHDLRGIGNEATHQHKGDHTTALTGLKIARQLAIWFHRTYTDRGFKPGPFQPPRAPPDPSTGLREELERLKSELDRSLSAAEAAEAARLAAEQRAQAKAAIQPPASLAQLHQAADAAARAIDLDEAATRDVIDARLEAQGWEADSRSLRHAAGTRPMKGRPLAIAEWPTANGPAELLLERPDTPSTPTRRRRTDRGRKLL